MASTTFKARSLTDLVEIRAREQPEDVAVWTGASNFGTEWKSLTHRQLLRAVDRIAWEYQSLSHLDAGPNPPEQRVSVLTSHAIDMSILEIALAKVGIAALLLSINNSAAAVAHLCKITESTHLIYGPQYKATAEEAQGILREQNPPYALELRAETRFPLWGSGGVDEAQVEPYKPRFTPDEETGRTCVILHSSGSTGFPKPNYITHRGLVGNLAPGLPLGSYSALPLFHGFGHYAFFRSLYHAQPFVLFFPHIPLTGPNLVKSISTSPRPPDPRKNQQLSAVPYVIKLLAETPGGVECLASFAGVSFAGAALPDDLGDRLTSQGVHLFAQYGTTETGAIVNSKRNYETDKAWNWLRVEGLIENLHKLEERGSGTYEMVVLDGWPGKVVSNRPDNSFATKDLFIRHPEHSSWIKYVGRLDDTITQILGEKTNPVPIELAIRGNSPYIEEVIVFGDGKPQVGCLILPSDEAKDIWQDKEKYLNMVMPVIEQANKDAPSHSRIQRDMVEVLPYGTEIPRATKMSILRPACYKKFDSLIQEVYDRSEKGNAAGRIKLSTQPEMEDFVGRVIRDTVGSNSAKGKLSNDTDLFLYGLDSLHSIRIRNVITRSVDLNGAELGQDIVYQYPSIQKLARHLLSVSAPGPNRANGHEEDVNSQMWSMVDHYSGLLEKKEAAGSSPRSSNTSEVVVLTGATGSLGAHILDQLIHMPQVTLVVCLCRAENHQNALDRVQASLQQRRRNVSPKVTGKIRAMAADYNNPSNLGLTAAEYQALRSSVTMVIHNAWPVNFSMNLDSFAPHIMGVVNLINLILRSPRTSTPRFFFSSSVATRSGKWESQIEEATSRSPDTAAKMGYGRSKWVVEQICQRAASGDSGAWTGILRIGQLCGDTENGVWNETEAWPLMLKAATTMGALPNLTEELAWLPVNQAASAIRDIVLSSGVQSGSVFHILNPAWTSWSTIIKGLEQAGIKFKVVPGEEWLRLLRESDPDANVNPTIKLLNFYENRLKPERQKAPKLEFSVARSGEFSPTIQACMSLSPDNVAQWVAQWKASGFFVAAK